MADKLQVVSPIDGRIYVERPLADAADIDRALETARQAQRRWRQVPIDERAGIFNPAVEALVSQADEIGLEITWQMGRPIRYTPA
jgi:acyl-CoA reductase-like NAD-dependent aldehyde dehydrogenase